MSRSIVLVLGVCVFSAHSAVYKTQDATLNRIARSPHYGSSYHHDDFELPPPPYHGQPVVYHTQNWSGVAKGPGGAAQGVFSGAAASAQSAVPALSEAFSLAASGTGPVSSDKGGQVKENFKKSGFGSHSNYGSSGSQQRSGSFGNKYGGVSNGYASSDEGQYNIKSGLEIVGGTTGSGSEEYENQSGQSNAGNAGFDSKLANGVSTGYGQSSGNLKSLNFDRESGQRSINSGFNGKSFGGESAVYGSHSRPYGSSRGLSDTRHRGDIGSGSLTDGNSAGSESADFDSQSGQHNLQTSNNGFTEFNEQTDQFSAGSGFSGKSVSGVTASSNQFGQNNGQSSRSGYQGGGRASRRFNSHGSGYGTRPEIQNDGGYGGGHHGDIHRNGKSHHEVHHIEQSGKQFGNQGNADQGFGDNGQVSSTGFSASQSSSFGTNKGNYGSGSIGSEAGYSGNPGQTEQSGKLDAGFTSRQGGSRDFSGGQQVKQVDQFDAGFSANQAGSRRLSGGRSQSSSASDYGFKGDRFKGDSKGALVANDANGGISPTNEAEGSSSSDAGASDHEDIQSTLGSALNLAAQGLQTAQRTPCSTCDKGSYALSNAKSHSGSAIALSIGG